MDVFFLLQNDEGAYATVELDGGAGLLVFTTLERALEFRSSLERPGDYHEVGLDAGTLSELLGEIEGVSYVLRDHATPRLEGDSDSVLDLDFDALSPDDTGVVDLTAILRRSK